MKYVRLLPALAGLVILGCQKESITITELFIDEELAPYLERFQEEAATRGITIDFAAAGISAFLEDIEEESVSGQCRHQSDGSHQLVIDTGFWRQATEVRKEFVVFHELGHCALGRGHLDTSLADGTCASMMHSGLSGCRNAYNNLTRSYYLDELFLNE